MVWHVHVTYIIFRVANISPLDGAVKPASICIQKIEF